MSRGQATASGIARRAFVHSDNGRMVGPLCSKRVGSKICHYHESSITEPLRFCQVLSARWISGTCTRIRSCITGRFLSPAVLGQAGKWRNGCPGLIRVRDRSHPRGPIPPYQYITFLPFLSTLCATFASFFEPYEASVDPARAKCDTLTTYSSDRSAGELVFLLDIGANLC